MAAGGLKVLASRHPRVVAWLGLFAALVCVRYPALSDPPYWGTAIGPFAEGLWLKSHHFDYLELIRNQPRFADGGPAACVWSVVPTIYAVLYSFLSPSNVFVLLHVVTLGLTALIAVLCYGILRDLMALNARVSACVTAAMLCQPMYTGQIDAIGVEIPAGAFVMLSANAMLRRRFRQASAFAAVGMLISYHAAVVCLANLAFVVLLLLVGKRRDGWGPVLAGVAFPAVLALVVAVLTPSSGTVAAAASEPLLRPGASRLLVQLSRCVPDLVFVYVVAVLAVALSWRVGKQVDSEGEAAAPFLDLAESPGFYSLLVAGMGLVGFICMGSPAPRYLATYLPFIFLAVCAALRRCRASDGQLLAVFLVVLSANAINNQGVFYSRLPAAWGRDGALLERSQEGRRDLRSQLRLAAFLEEHASNRAVAATWPLVQALTVPELGYVKRPLNVFTFGRYMLSYAPVRDIGTLSPSQLNAVLLIHQPSVFDTMAPYSLKPREFDRIVYTETVAGSDINVYVLGKPSAPTNGKQSPDGVVRRQTR